MNNEEQHKKSHRRALLGTILFHVGLFLLLLFMFFKPPMTIGGEEGILVNFGYDENAYGENEPLGSVQQEEMIAQRIEESVTENSPGEREIITQDFEESVALEDQKKSDRETVKPENVPVEDTKREKVEADNSTAKDTKDQEATPQREVNPMAMFPGSEQGSTQNGNEGITEGNGNMGNPNGIPGVDNYVGTGGGGGIGFDLQGRSPLKRHKPDNTCNKSGIVVVRITVDKYGNVINVLSGYKGTTVQDDCLINIAERSARQWKFDSNPGMTEQTGTITYKFTFN